MIVILYKNTLTNITYAVKKINYVLRCGLNTFEIYLVQNGNELKLIDERKYVKIVEFLGDESLIGNFANKLSKLIKNNNKTKN